jgi:hypothetical protein
MIVHNMFAYLQFAIVSCALQQRFGMCVCTSFIANVCALLRSSVYSVKCQCGMLLTQTWHCRCCCYLLLGTQLGRAAIALVAKDMKANLCNTCWCGIFEGLGASNDSDYRTALLVGSADVFQACVSDLMVAAKIPASTLRVILADDCKPPKLASCFATSSGARAGRGSATEMSAGAGARTKALAARTFKDMRRSLENMVRSGIEYAKLVVALPVMIPVVLVMATGGRQSGARTAPAPNPKPAPKPNPVALP